MDARGTACLRPVAEALDVVRRRRTAVRFLRVGDARRGRPVLVPCACDDLAVAAALPAACRRDFVPQDLPRRALEAAATRRAAAFCPADGGAAARFVAARGVLVELPSRCRGRWARDCRVGRYWVRGCGWRPCMCCFDAYLAASARTTWSSSCATCCTSVASLMYGRAVGTVCVALGARVWFCGGTPPSLAAISMCWRRGGPRRPGAATMGDDVAASLGWFAAVAVACMAAVVWGRLAVAAAGGAP